MTKEEIVRAILALFSLITMVNLTNGLVPAPWDTYLIVGLSVGWLALVYKFVDWWQNRR